MRGAGPGATVERRTVKQLAHSTKTVGTLLRVTSDGADGPPLEQLHAEFFRTRAPLLREQLLEAHAGLARGLAKRFTRRGHSLDDLSQVAFLALIKAIDGFDPERGLQFSTYAMPTILGELKRHMRDQSWGIRPPRRVHDMYLEVERAVDDLTQGLGRRPTIAEVGDSLGLDEEDVLEAMEAAGGRQLTSLEGPASQGLPLSESVGSRDRHIGDVERTLAVDALLNLLSEDDEIVVRMRFEDEMTQLDIARVLGRSQMQVSRTLARSLERLRRLAGPTGEALLTS
jgi:RNA polymerase sigma-B factor